MNYNILVFGSFAALGIGSDQFLYVVEAFRSSDPLNAPVVLFSEHIEPLVHVFLYLGQLDERNRVPMVEMRTSMVL